MLLIMRSIIEREQGSSSPARKFGIERSLEIQNFKFQMANALA